MKQLLKLFPKAKQLNRLMDLIALNYDDPIDAIEMIKSSYKCDHDKKRQKKEISGEIQDILRNIEEIEKLNNNNYIEQCMNIVPNYPDFSSCENLPLIINHKTDFKKLKDHVRYNHNSFEMKNEIERFLKYVKDLVDHSHCEKILI